MERFVAERLTHGDNVERDFQSMGVPFIHKHPACIQGLKANPHLTASRAGRWATPVVKAVEVLELRTDGVGVVMVVVVGGGECEGWEGAAGMMDAFSWQMVDI